MHERMLGRPSSRIVAIGLATTIAALASAAGSGSAAPTVPMRVAGARGVTATPVRIEVRLRSPGRGTFTMSGALSDRGSVIGKSRFDGRQAHLTQTLVGSRGAIRLRIDTSCASGKGKWQVLSGSRAYAGLTAGGAASGGPRCGRPSYPARIVLGGVARVPEPPPIARAGQYGGATSQREVVVLDVLPGGRQLAELRVERITVRCVPTFSLLETITLPGPYDLAADGSFSVQTTISSRLTETVTGRVTASGTASGTATISASITNPVDQSPVECNATIPWTATMPPPTAVPGKYCGFTLRGHGICLDVAPGGKEVTGFTTTVVLRCQPSSELELTLTFTGTIPIGPNLGFRETALVIEDLPSGTVRISGYVESNGTAAGSVGTSSMTVEYEGVSYRCFTGGTSWTATRQP